MLLNVEKSGKTRPRTVIKCRSYRAQMRKRKECGFSSWNILVICRGTVQIECKHEQIFVTALIALRANFLRRSCGFFAINQSAGTSLASFPQVETCTPDHSKKKLGTSVGLLCI